MTDMVNHPSHYTAYQAEVKDVIFEILDYLKLPPYESYVIGNVIKYIIRAPFKNGLEDINKAEFYLKTIQRVKTEGIVDYKGVIAEAGDIYDAQTLEGTYPLLLPPALIDDIDNNGDASKEDNRMYLLAIDTLVVLMAKMSTDKTVIALLGLIKDFKEAK